MLGELLVEQGIIEAGVLVQALARRLGFAGCHLRHGLIDPALLRLIGEEEAGRLKAIGRKQSRWLNTLYMQRALGPGADTPPDVEPA